jgi:hypothetical protein
MQAFLGHMRSLESQTNLSLMWTLHIKYYENNKMGGALPHGEIRRILIKELIALNCKGGKGKWGDKIVTSHEDIGMWPLRQWEGHKVHT